jgi:dTDP-4-amino-4,6-dideoxygalactose transaminase
MAVLQANDIGCGIHYPVPLHEQEAYADLGYAKGTFPIAEKVASELVSLPMFPALTHAQIRFGVEPLNATV